MALTCPRCLRNLADSADPTDRPVFCMYCGQRLRGDTTPLPPPAAVMPDPAETVDAPTHSFANDQTPDFEPGQPPRSGPPDELGGYRLGKFLGAGGMGTVYEAEALESGQRVALKILSGRLASSPSHLERFRQEGRVASQISHPHCVFVFRADADAGHPYIVMELMPGRTLSDLVDQQGPLSIAEAIRRILDVIDGLSEAHRLGVIHRDVKPSNCFLTDDDRVKVGDFGLSKSLTGGRGDAQLTQSGAFLGTVLFASPEQIRGEPVGYESDVYAVCGTLYFLLTGRAPHQHESVTASLARAVSEPPPPIRGHRSDVPLELERVVLRGLDRDRDRRWQSLDELGDTLRELLPDAQKPARPKSLVLAYLVDSVILQIVMVPVELLRQWALGFRNFDVTFFETNWSAIALAVAYFALFEGLLGWTPGKRLLRMQVSRVGETGPPGVVHALVRALVFIAMLMLIINLPEWLLQWLGGAFSLFLALASAAVGVGLLLYQLWPKAGWYRGLHDFASGCRTIQRPRPALRVRLVSRFPNPIDLPQPTTDPLPGSIGGFIVSAKVSDLPDGGEVWAGEDKGLGRRVLVRVLGPGNDNPICVEEPVTRPTRLRVVGHGSLVWKGAERDWVGYVAPAGAPLVDVVDPARPLAWADARPLLEQLANELAAADEDGSGVERPTVEQVWVEPGGRLQLLDFPLPTGASGERQPPELAPPRGADAPCSPEPLAFVRELATLTLEGTPRAEGGRVRAPLPPHASRITDRLFAEDEEGYRTINQLRVDLEEGRGHPAVVTSGVRAAHLSAQAAMLSFGLVMMFLFSGLFSFFVAVVIFFQVQGYEQVRAMVASPAARAILLDSVRQLPDADSRQRLVQDLSPEGTPRTLQALDEVIAQQRTVSDRQSEYLNKPERALYDRFRQVMQDAPPQPSDMSAEQIELILRGFRQPETAESNLDRWAYLFGFAILVVVWPLLWAVFAFAFRGGLAMSLAGITLVRPDGRRAGRFRCAIRELLVWLPVTLLLLACMWVQAALPHQVVIRTALWLAAALLLPVYVMAALRNPTQPPQDRILGTHLVPV